MEMSTWTQDLVATGRAAAAKASATVHRCGAQMVVGYSNLGIPMATCPVCSPSIAANARRTVGAAWGFNDGSGTEA